MDEHGGNLDLAVRLYGGTYEDWIDLSTGINPYPYPFGNIPERAWSCLPTAHEIGNLERIAGIAYGVSDLLTVAISGAQTAIQMIPLLRSQGLVRVLSPTYSEHATAFKNSGWKVENVSTLEELNGADVGVVVNPNNPDGRHHQPLELLNISSSIGILLVDESFCDLYPELSVAPLITDQSESIIVLRSFGKFYGLAGLRLGFALSGKNNIDNLRQLAGPWPVSGPAISVASIALADREWRTKTLKRINYESAKLDQLANQSGLKLVGGTLLFRTYKTDRMNEIKKQLIQQRIWARFFQDYPDWIRLGLPAKPEHWHRVRRALVEK
ncbi:MAG: threonine-phosphate decarboxylase CobD [Gammaproteobacteria bacterium]|nr:threonine-phosphate decarboxylase CobD [Gammaproteobacteria bacterium]